MALAIANTSPQNQALSLGGLNGVLKTVTFDSSYPTGGESFSPADVGLSSFYLVAVFPDANALPGHVVQYNYTSGKLMVFVEEAVAAGGPLLEIANTSNLGTLVVRVLCLGV